MTGSYKQLRVWQDAMALAADVYRLTDRFPRHELYGLTNQVRRAAVSVPSNIAEGKGHRSSPEFLHFLFHARGSLHEMETQLCLAGKLQYLRESEVESLLTQTGAVARSLNALINSLGKPRRPAFPGQRPTTTD
jgi:four helix bundle protein